MYFTMAEIDQLIERIVKESGKSREEVEGMMNKRKEATHGLLSDYGAIYAVAKEFGIALEEEEEIILTKASDVKAQVSANLAGRVKTVYPPKEFQKKDGGIGRIASLILSDDSGDIRLVLWDSNSKIAESINKGDVLMVRNGYGREGRGEGVELHATSLTTLSVNPKLDIELPEIMEELVEIKDLEKGMPSVDTICRVNYYYPPTEFDRPDGSKGARASFIAEDETGTIRVVLWDKATETDTGKGDVIKIENAYTRDGLNGELELHAGNRSRIIHSKEKIDLPPLSDEKKELSIGEIKAGDGGFTTIGRIMQVYTPRSYSKGMMSSLTLGDKSGVIRAVLWDEKSDIANELKKGDAVKIVNAYSKANLDEVPEIHVGRYSDVVINQDLKIESLDKIEESMIKEKDIIDLENMDRYVKIKGGIVGVDEDRRVLYMTCPECGRKVNNMGTGWFCESCNDNVEPSPNLVVSLTLEDDTGSIRVVSFRDNAEKILGLDVEEVMNLIGETQDEFAPVANVKDNIIGEKIAVTGRVKYNEFSDQLEFIADEVA